jgi:cytochrome P450
MSRADPLPLAPGLPLLGSLGPMLDDPLRFLVDAYRKCGPVFRLRVLNRRFVVIAGVEANLFMVRHEREFLQNGPIFAGFGAELGGELFLAAADGDTHKQLRKIQSKSYSNAHIETRIPEVIAGMRRRLGALRPGQRLDVQRLFQLLLAEQVGLVLHNHADLAGYLDDLIRVFRVALTVRVMKRWPPLMLHWPAYQRSRRRILAHAERVLAEHPSGAGNDLVDDILTALERKQIRAENMPLLTLGPLFGGIDTASNTSSFVLYNILSRPALRARVMQEVATVFADPTPGTEGRALGGPGPKPTPSWSAFQQATALRGAMMETLRMFPAAYLSVRHVAKSFEFAGHRIEAGEQLFVATAVPHFLAEHFPDPLTFDVDRYSPERHENAQPGAFAPFGTGVHACLGARFAQSQMIVTLATLLHDLELDIDPPDYRLRVKSNPVTMPEGFVVRVRGTKLDAAGARWPAFDITS